MPDAAQLDVQLQHPASKTSSPRPPSPPQSSLDILVNSPPPPSDQTANQNKQQISSVNNQQQPHPSTTNGVVNHSQPPVTAAPPSVLSNPDPNASLQSILAATRKDQISPEVALHHWGIAPVPGPPQHSTPHHAALIPQLSSSKNGKRKLDEGEQDDPHPKIRRTVRDHVSQDPTRIVPMTTVMCLHAAVAQKSYGSEKRFLCPPPVVHIQGPMWQMRSQQLSMAVVSEQGERSFDQKTALDNSMSGSFKFLHVTGTAKAKSFTLSLDIMDPPSTSGESSDNSGGRVWASFDSAPVTIISKPSKKTAKTRNISSCILAGGPVSLFNRINSQTVRTKYMTIDSAQLCASNVSWSAFNVNVVRRPEDPPPTHGGPQPVTYGCEVVLSDTLSNIATSPLVIRKVDKGRVSPEDGGPVSQMQKIALQRVNADGSRHYLSAAGPIPGPPGVSSSTPGVSSQGGTHPLIFQSPRVREEMKDGIRVLCDEVDDYLCWTIVGISKFQYTFFDAFGQNNSIPEIPITPFPTLFTAPVYRPANNVLELTVSNFFYEEPKSRTQQSLTVYLGNIGPLRARCYPPHPAGPLTNISYGGTMPGPSSELAPNDGTTAGATPNVGGAPTGRYPHLHTMVTVEMPSLAEVIKSLQEDAMPANVLGPDGAEPHTASSDETVTGAQADSAASGVSQGPTAPAQPSIAGRSLPILFIRASDGVGYHSGRTITCENVFQSMDLGGMTPGHALTPPGGATADPSWLAAAQAAATADGGLHGWTLRVM
ncbi:hypothetical protein BDN67DRAFT_1019861 [Paxillus ammoniavirescens]|nr:hypothetical protein BDN67DRAFT_1019861 [Paxillus ammoniavirescens]